jgi:hypothetical protein
MAAGGSGDRQRLDGFVVLAEYVAKAMVQVVQGLTDFARTGVLTQEAVTAKPVRQMSRPVGKGISSGSEHEIAFKRRQEADHSGHVSGLSRARSQRIGDHDHDRATAIVHAEAMRTGHSTTR